MKTLNLVQRWLWSAIGWAGFSYPPAPKLPPKPWHTDGDAAFRRVPTQAVAKSAAIIAHMKASPGRFLVQTGVVKPHADGRVAGVRVNGATAKDPQYEIHKELGAGRLTVTTGYRAPYGRRVRIGRDVVTEGYPGANIDDVKLHVVDPIDRTVTEVQYIEQLGNLTTCHGVQVADLDASSFDALGSTAARVPLAETTLRYDDMVAGVVQMTTFNTPRAHDEEFVAPALKTDGKCDDADAIRMGMVIRLRPEIAEAILADPKVATIAKTIVRCLAGPGAMCVDTSNNTCISLDPDARWDQKALAPLRALTLDDFTVWQH